MSDVSVSLTVALTHAATNLDNMALLFALLPSLGAVRAVAGYASSQAIALVLALFVGGVVEALPVQWISWLGLIPIGIGLREAWVLYRGESLETVPDRPPTSLILTVLLFLPLTVDTFAVMTAIFADSSKSYDPIVFIGGAISIATVSAAGVLFGRVASKAEALTRRLEIVTPFVMILAGLYVLFDTPTDVI